MVFYPKLYLRYPFEITRVGDETIAVPIDDGAEAYHGVIQLNNEPAEFMFTKLKDGITLPELIMECMKHYDDTVENVGPKVIEFLDRLKEQDLLRADNAKGTVDDQH